MAIITHPKLVVIIIAIAMLLVSSFGISYSFTNNLDTSFAETKLSGQVSIVNPTPTAAQPTPIELPEPLPTEVDQAEPEEVESSSVIDSYSEPVTAKRILLDESYLLSKIKELGALGGEVVLDQDLTILSQDVILPSNVALRGANPEITVFLSGYRLGIAQGAANVTICDLTFDASGLGERHGFVIAPNASNVNLNNLRVINHYNRFHGFILNFGNGVILNNISFENIPHTYPIQLDGSNVSVRNCSSSDSSIFALIDLGGGNSNIDIISNSAVNRPLLSANRGYLPTKNIRVENNTVFFPKPTYGLLIRGGVGDNFSVSHENVIVKGNFFRADVGAGNAIAIYGFTRNVVVEGNTVDQSLSGHNGIGISSGINVTVIENVVYGAVGSPIEPTEGGIEVESNPVHNRAVGASENVTVTGNTVYNSFWGIYVRIMFPDHPNWNGTLLLSKHIVIENNLVYNCSVGVNLLHGEDVIVRNNDIGANTVSFAVDPLNVFNYSVIGNVGYP